MLKADYIIINLFSLSGLSQQVCHPKNIIKNILILLNNISVLFSLFENIQIIQIICKLSQIIGGGFS